MNEVKTIELRTPIEVALDIDSEGMTTARKLYNFLGLAQGQFSRWAKSNITDNEFATENEDYWRFDIDVETPTGGIVKRDDYKLTAHFAKKLSVKGNSEKAELEISALRALVELENSPVAARIDKAYEAFTTQQNKIDINKNFYDKVAEYCDERKMPISAFEKMCSIGNGTCGRWRNNMSSPTLTTIQKIADATGIPIEKWIK